MRANSTYAACPRREVHLTCGVYHLLGDLLEDECRQIFVAKCDRAPHRDGRGRRWSDPHPGNESAICARQVGDFQLGALHRHLRSEIDMIGQIFDDTKLDHAANGAMARGAAAPLHAAQTQWEQRS